MPDYNYSTLLVDKKDRILTVTLNRPERLNAWTNRMGDEVKHAVAEAEADERGWVYIDPNDLLRQLAQDTSAIRPPMKASVIFPASR